MKFAKFFQDPTLGFYKLRGQTSYHKVSRSLEEAKLDLALIVSFWNLTSISGSLFMIKFCEHRSFSAFTHGILKLLVTNDVKCRLFRDEIGVTDLWLKFSAQTRWISQTRAILKIIFLLKQIIWTIQSQRESSQGIGWIFHRDLTMMAR